MWGKRIARLEMLWQDYKGMLDRIFDERSQLRREIDECRAELRSQRSTIDALLIAKGQAQASGAGLAGMLREAADEAAAVEDEEAEAAREEADSFADFLKKYEKDDLDG